MIIHGCCDVGYLNGWSSPKNQVISNRGSPELRLEVETAVAFGKQRVAIGSFKGSCGWKGLTWTHWAPKMRFTYGLRMCSTKQVQKAIIEMQQNAIEIYG